jgi:hypothetical protein
MPKRPREVARSPLQACGVPPQGAYKRGARWGRPRWPRGLGQPTARAKATAPSGGLCMVEGLQGRCGVATSAEVPGGPPALGAFCRG